MISASRIGTPAEISVPSVRVNRAMVVFSTSWPITGIFSRIRSKTTPPACCGRSLMKIQMAIGTMNTI